MSRGALSYCEVKNVSTHNGTCFQATPGLNNDLYQKINPKLRNRMALIIPLNAPFEEQYLNISKQSAVRCFDKVTYFGNVYQFITPFNKSDVRSM